MTLVRIVTTITVNHIVTTVTEEYTIEKISLYTIVAYDIVSSIFHFLPC